MSDWKKFINLGLFSSQCELCDIHDLKSNEHLEPFSFPSPGAESFNHLCLLVWPCSYDRRVLAVGGEAGLVRLPESMDSRDEGFDA